MTTTLRVHRPWEHTFARFEWPTEDVPRKLREARDNGATAHRDDESCQWCDKSQGEVAPTRRKHVPLVGSHPSVLESLGEEGEAP